jgi:outer membrane protein OmpA-like peptidoglycan-associated protein
MSAYQHARTGILHLVMIVASGFLLIADCRSVTADERPTESQILNALKPSQRITRGLTATPAAPVQQNTQQQNFIGGLRSTRTRSLTLDQRNELAVIAKERPSIDLEIYFDFNSADIASKSVPDVITLGRALTNPELQGGVFLIAGHTDAKGGQDYNQKLSERRAQAVREYLIENFRIASDSLVAAGYGKEQLKNRANPFGGENRRVQITNLQSKQEAGR